MCYGVFVFEVIWIVPRLVFVRNMEYGEIGTGSKHVPIVGTLVNGTKD